MSQPPGERDEMEVLRLHLNSVLVDRNYVLCVENEPGTGYYAVTTLGSCADLKKFLEAQIEQMKQEGMQDLYP